VRGITTQNKASVRIFPGMGGESEMTETMKSTLGAKVFIDRSGR